MTFPSKQRQEDSEMFAYVHIRVMECSFAGFSYLYLSYGSPNRTLALIFGYTQYSEVRRMEGG